MTAFPQGFDPGVSSTAVHGVVGDIREISRVPKFQAEGFSGNLKSGSAAALAIYLFHKSLEMGELLVVVRAFGA